MVEAEECVQKQSVNYEAVWYILTVYPGQVPKTEMLAKFHLSAADMKGVRLQFVQNLSYFLLGVQ